MLANAKYCRQSPASAILGVLPVAPLACVAEATSARRKAALGLRFSFVAPLPPVELPSVRVHGLLRRKLLSKLRYLSK
jgi:hypothetical protein